MQPPEFAAGSAYGQSVWLDLGISMGDVADRLLDEGIALFVEHSTGCSRL